MTEHDDPSIVEALVEETPDALIALSASGEVLFWNHGAEVVFGYSRKEAIGKTLSDLVVPSEYQKEAREYLEQAIRTGSAVFETVRKRKDGTLVDVDVSKRVVKDGAGKFRFIVANKKDVTALKRLRQEKDSKFQSLLEAAPDAIVVTKKTGEIELVNTQAVNREVSSENPIGVKKTETVQRGRVLIIDDEPDLAETLGQILSKEHDVVVMTNGRRAFELLLKDNDFDVILSDLTMPDMAGMDMHAELRRLKNGVEDRIVFVTGGVFTPRAQEFMQTITNQCLNKPIDMRGLRKMVEGLVKKRRENGLRRGA